ncbi:MAG: anthranilate/aminodeoxychorismate synthase component II [Gammaproteobacteria bacterium]|nr:MAG: anthranilate/aminodeoxychorismate synthase component II [Gammaproteobacteria bacterium]PIE36439.1 MAG: anthranilate/aminodeoxychorismate synthase component II [Gammaproteobacteria bacterium]
MKKARLTVIDNYDSFTWNLVQYIGELGVHCEVYRNDEISVEELAALEPSALLVSPGPSTPDNAGISLAAIRALAGQVPILGVCLGHQAIGQHYGGVIDKAQRIMHGKLSAVHHDGTSVFRGLPTPFTVTRYHSLVITPASLPSELIVTAWTLDDAGEREEIMAVRHRELPIHGVQFHPESISSEQGRELLANFLVEAGYLDRDSADERLAIIHADLAARGTNIDNPLRQAAGEASP